MQFLIKFIEQKKRKLTTEEGNDILKEISYQVISYYKMMKLKW